MCLVGHSDFGLTDTISNQQTYIMYILSLSIKHSCVKNNNIL